ncbi:TPA: restriction endonuclease subunit S [Vibrio campbellii]
MSNVTRLTLGEISDSCLGKMLDKKKNRGSFHPYLANYNVRWGEFDLSDVQEMKFEDHEHERYGLEYGDLVICEGGEPGRCAIWRDNAPDMKIQKALHRLRVKSGFSHDFLFYRMLLANRTGELQKYFIGSTIKHLTGVALKQVEFDFPSYEKQVSIAAVLRSLDKKIELNNRISNDLKVIAQTLYDYWFVQFDFPNGDGKPYRSSGGQMVYSETLKRNIPVDWEAVNLEYIISRSGTGLNPRTNFKLGEGSNYYVTIKSIGGGKVSLDDKCDRISDESLTIINNRSDLKVGDVLFTSIQPVGETYFIQEKPKNWNINESVFTLRADTKQVTPEYLYMLLSSQEMKAYTKQSSAGSIHKGIRHGVLKEFLLPFGGKEITKEFSKVLSPVLKKQALIEKENRVLSETRDWLLPMLMNGQVTVK